MRLSLGSGTRNLSQSTTITGTLRVHRIYTASGADPGGADEGDTSLIPTDRRLKV